MLRNMYNKGMETNEDKGDHTMKTTYGIKVTTANGAVHVLTRHGFWPMKYAINTTILRGKYRPRTWKTRDGAQRNADKCTTKSPAEIFEIQHV